MPMFSFCGSLVGSAGTKYNHAHKSVAYAHVDEPGNPGYFSAPCAHKTVSAWKKDSSNHWKVCSTCGETLNKSEHTFDDGSVQRAATCTSGGTTRYTCTVCGYTKTQTVPATGHTLVKTEAEPATCEAAGHTEYWTCSGCSKIFGNENGTKQITLASTVIVATGHDWDEGTVTKEPTEAEEGVRTYTCKNDPSHTRTESIKRLDHTHIVSDEWSYDDYFHWHACSVCGDALQKTSHTWDEGTVTTAPGCEATGTKTYTCTVCGTVKEQTIPATNHNWDTGTVTKEPTCEETGIKTYTCKNDASHTKTEDISATGHNWDTGTVTKEPSCEEPGIKTYTCKNDASHTKTEDIPATGHNWDTGIVTKEPSCEESGIKTFTCKNDPSHTREQVISATGHRWTDDEIITEATCTEKGTKRVRCTNCEATKEVAIPAAGHKWDNGIITKEATRTETGIMTYTCTVCGETKEESIPVQTIPDPDGSYTMPIMNTSRIGTGGVGTGEARNEEALTWDAKISGNILTWSSADGADRFVISAKKKGETTWKRIGTTTKNSYELSALNGSYTIMVRYEKDGVLAKARNSAKTAAEIKAAKPVVTAAVKDEYVILRWKAVDGASSYRVFKYSDGKLKKIGSTSKTQIRVKGTSGSKYAVKAYINGKWTKITKADIVTAE